MYVGLLLFIVYTVDFSLFGRLQNKEEMHRRAYRPPTYITLMTVFSRFSGGVSAIQG